MCSVQAEAREGAAQGTLVCDFALPGWPLLHHTSSCAELLGGMPLTSMYSTSTSSAGSRQQLLWQLFGQPGAACVRWVQMRQWPCSARCCCC